MSRFVSTVAALGVSAGVAYAQEATSGVFTGHGVVEAVQPGTGLLTIAHDDIKGFMPAMKMMYKVKTPDLARDLHPGEEIDFKIDAANYTVIEVKPVGQAK
jgi:Cu/Ag efflux protein CusF